RAGRRNAASERHRQQRDIGLPGDADRAERGEVLGHELAIEKREIADLQARNEPRQRNLRGVRLPAEHALAEEGAAELHSIEPADQLAVLPDFDRMGMTGAMERNHRMLELGV